MISQAHLTSNLVSLELERFLSSSRLSMTGLARKLQVSKAQLSLIKNNKKAPSLDLGLKILKYAGTQQELRKEWALEHISQNSEEYEELENSVRSELKKIKHSQNVCDRFESNLTLMNLYLDVLNAENGISAYLIEKNYGKESLPLMEALIQANLIRRNHDKLEADDTRSVLTKRSSFNFMKSIFDDQRDKHDAGCSEGKFQFIMDDVDPEGQKKLQELLLRTMKEAGDIIKSHERPRSKGGKRVIFQVLKGVVKGPMLALILVLMTTLPGWAGGVEGGSSPMGGVEGGSSTVIRIQLTSDAGRERLDSSLLKIQQEISEDHWNPLKEKGLAACREKYRFVNRENIQLTLRELSFDRYWINREEHHAANGNILIKCSPNFLLRNIK